MRSRLSGHSVAFCGLALLFLAGGCGAEGEIAPPPPPPAPPPGPMAALPPSPAPAPVQPAAPAAAEPARAPMAEVQKRAIMAYTAAFNAHDGKKAAEVYARDCVVASPGPTGMVEQRGRDLVEQMHTGLFAAFPDLKVAPVRVFQKGDVAVEEWVTNGTHKGDFMGMKASNKATGFNAISVYWFDAEGTIKRDDTYFDAGTIAVQTGAQKGRARAVPKMPAGEGEWIVAKGAPEEDHLLELVKAFYGSYEKKDEKAFLELLAPELVHSSMNEADDKNGKNAAKEDFGAFQKAFPDLKLSAQNAWAFGNYVVSETIFTGTNKGPMGPIKATNKPLGVHYVDVFQFKDGKIARSTSYASNIEMLGQLGLLNPPKPPEPKKEPAKGEGSKPTPKPADGGKTGTPAPKPDAKATPPKPPSSATPSAPPAPKSSTTPAASPPPKPPSSATPAAPKKP